MKETGREKYEMERLKREEVCDETKDVERRKGRKEIGKKGGWREKKLERK